MDFKTSNEEVGQIQPNMAETAQFFFSIVIAFSDVSGPASVENVAR